MFVCSWFLSRLLRDTRIFNRRNASMVLVVGGGAWLLQKLLAKNNASNHSKGAVAKTGKPHDRVQIDAVFFRVSQQGAL
jgi:hypothetical protein